MLYTKIIIFFLFYFLLNIASYADDSIENLGIVLFEKTDEDGLELLKKAPQENIDDYHNKRNKKVSAKHTITYYPQIHYVEIDSVRANLNRLYALSKQISHERFMKFFLSNSLSEHSDQLKLLGEIFSSQYMIYHEIHNTIMNLDSGKKVTIFQESLPYFGFDLCVLNRELLKDVGFEYEHDSIFSLIVNGAAVFLKHQYPDKVNLIGTHIPFISIQDNTVPPPEKTDKEFQYFQSVDEIKYEYMRCTQLSDNDSYDDPKCHRLLVHRQREVNAVVSINHYLSKKKVNEKIFLIFGTGHVFSDFNNDDISFQYSSFDWGVKTINEIREKIYLQNHLRSFYNQTKKDFDLLYPFLEHNSKESLKSEFRDIYSIFDYKHPDFFKLLRNIYLGTVVVSLAVTGFIFANPYGILF